MYSMKYVNGDGSQKKVFSFFQTAKMCCEMDFAALRIIKQGFQNIIHLCTGLC